MTDTTPNENLSAATDQLMDAYKQIQDALSETNIRDDRGAIAQAMTASMLIREAQNKVDAAVSELKQALWPDSQGLGRALRAIEAERYDQHAKWGRQQYTTLGEWLIILGEEYGEACKRSLEVQHDLIPIRAHTLHSIKDKWLLEEVVQIAAVACAMIELLQEDEPTATSD